MKTGLFGPCSSNASVNDFDADGKDDDDDGDSGDGGGGGGGWASVHNEGLSMVEHTLNHTGQEG